MKKLLLAFATVFCLVSCGGSDDPFPTPTPEPQPQPEPGEPKEYVVSLGFQGEITSIEEGPLGRSSTDDLYGIQVYSKPIDATTYVPYAYGLFDDKAKMTIKLLEGYEYRFECTMIVDGKEKVLIHPGGYYTPPFYINDKSYLNNNFTYSTNDSFEYLSYGNTFLEEYNEIYHRPNTDRYYGQVIGYAPRENSNLKIDMDRGVFGIKCVFENFNEGKIIINLQESPELVLDYGTSKEIQEIYTFEDLSQLKSLPEYSEIIPVSIYWEKTDGAKVPLASKDITFKRNKLTTVNVKVLDSSKENTIEITTEAADLGDGGTVDIKPGEGIDTGIDPTP